MAKHRRKNWFQRIVHMCWDCWGTGEEVIYGPVPYDRLTDEEIAYNVAFGGMWQTVHLGTCPTCGGTGVKR